MDLSKLVWFKNVKTPSGWAYELDSMPMSEARIFRLHWHGRDDKVRANAQQPQKGDLIALTQQAKVTHIVEVLDDTVYETLPEPWGLYRVVKAVWMPPKGFDWSQLPHQQEIFGVEHLPPFGKLHSMSTPSIEKSEIWQKHGGLQGLQEHISKLLQVI